MKSRYVYSIVNGKRYSNSICQCSVITLHRALLLLYLKSVYHTGWKPWAMGYTQRCCGVQCWLRAAETLNFIISQMNNVVNVDLSCLDDTSLLNEVGVAGLTSLHFLSWQYVISLIMDVCVCERESVRENSSIILKNRHFITERHSLRFLSN